MIWDCWLHITSAQAYFMHLVKEVECSVQDESVYSQAVPWGWRQEISLSDEEGPSRRRAYQFSSASDCTSVWAFSAAYLVYFCLYMYRMYIYIDKTFLSFIYLECMDTITTTGFLNELRMSPIVKMDADEVMFGSFHFLAFTAIFCMHDAISVSCLNSCVCCTPYYFRRILTLGAQTAEHSTQCLLPTRSVHRVFLKWKGCVVG